MKSRHIHIHTHTHSLHVGFRTSKFAQMAARFLLQLIDLALAALQGLESCARSLDEERRRIREDKSELAKFEKHVGIREALAMADDAKGRVKVSKSVYEQSLRHALGLPRHNTANDGAFVLMRLALLAAVASALILLSTPWIVGGAAAFVASAFAGLCVQQYAWYTNHVYVECWSIEGMPVAALTALSAGAFGFASLIISMLLPLSASMLVLGTLHVAMWTSYRWHFWGGLFDGMGSRSTEKKKRAPEEAPPRRLFVVPS